MKQSDLLCTSNQASAGSLVVLMYSQLMVLSFPRTCNPSYSHMHTIRPTSVETSARISHCPQHTLNTDGGRRLTDSSSSKVGVCVCVLMHPALTPHKNIVPTEAVYHGRPLTGEARPRCVASGLGDASSVSVCSPKLALVQRQTFRAPAMSGVELRFLGPERLGINEAAISRLNTQRAHCAPAQRRPRTSPLIVFCPQIKTGIN